VALLVAWASALLKLIAAGALLALDATLPDLAASAEVGCLPEWAAAMTCAVMKGSVVGHSTTAMVNGALKNVAMRRMRGFPLTLPFFDAMSDRFSRNCAR